MVGKQVTKTGPTVRERSMLYKGVVHLVLLCWSKSWVVTAAMLKVIEELHHRVARRITGMMARHKTSGEWECPQVDEALETAII